MILPHGTTPDITSETLGELVDTVRERAPLTQCMTNEVVTGFTANVLLALGASPAMVSSVEEGPIFTTVADGLLVNVGTVTAATVEAMQATARARHEAGLPWCLDPVAVGSLPLRTTLARELVGLQPSVVRGNASEIIGLVGGDGGGRGVDAGAEVAAASAAARQLAATTGGAVAVSGPVDEIHGAPGVVRLANGHELMTRVTGVGCALGAVVAAYLPMAEDPLLAACGATAVMTIAAEEAAERSHGPGSFAVELLDALGRLNGESLSTRVRFVDHEDTMVGDVR